MFDFLNAVDADDLLGAVSYAIRTLTHLGRVGGAQQVFTLPGEFTPAQVEFGRQIVATIEQVEGEPINSLDGDQVRQYIGDLYAAVDIRMGDDGSHAAEAERVLTRFRRVAPRDLVGAP